MDFAKLEAGRLTGHFRPANLGELTADLAASFRPAIEVVRRVSLDQRLGRATNQFYLLWG